MKCPYYLTGHWRGRLVPWWQGETTTEVGSGTDVESPNGGLQPFACRGLRSRLEHQRGRVECDPSSNRRRASRAPRAGPGSSSGSGLGTRPWCPTTFQAASERQSKRTNAINGLGSDWLHVESNWPLSAEQDNRVAGATPAPRDRTIFVAATRLELVWCHGLEDDLNLVPVTNNLTQLVIECNHA